MRKINVSAERHFENSKVDGSISRAAQDKYYEATKREQLIFQDFFCNLLNSKSMLEIGCSYGRDAKIYSQFCDTYVGIDLSDKGIEAAKKLALNNCSFVCGDAHALPFQRSKFDAVVVSSLLHHLDLPIALEEISRVLKPGGALIFREPLGINPILNLYRYMTPSARTDDEMPFQYEDVVRMRNMFEVQHEHFFGFFVLLNVVFRSSSLAPVFSCIDRILAKTPIKYLFWQIGGVYRNSKDE